MPVVAWMHFLFDDLQSGAIYIVLYSESVA